MSKKDFTSGLSAMDGSILGAFISDQEPETKESEKPASVPQPEKEQPAVAAPVAAPAESSPGEKAPVVHVSSPLGPKSRRIGVLIQPSLHDGLKEVAREQGISANEFIIRAVAAAVNKSRGRKA